MFRNLSCWIRDISERFQKGLPSETHWVMPEWLCDALQGLASPRVYSTGRLLLTSAGVRAIKSEFQQLESHYQNGSQRIQFSDEVTFWTRSQEDWIATRFDKLRLQRHATKWPYASQLNSVNDSTWKFQANFELDTSEVVLSHRFLWQLNRN